MPRNLPPRFRNHIAHARRMRIIGGALLVTCLLVGTGAALTQTQLPQQLTATLKPLATELGTSFSQLPSAISQRIPDIDLQLPTTQLAASATSFPQSVAEKVRNLFCRWLDCESDTLLAQQPPRPSTQQRATLPQNVKQPAPIPQTSPSDVARSATTTTQVVVSKAASSASPSASQQPIIERTQTIIQTGFTEALLDARLLALTNDFNSRLNQVAGARAYQAERTAENVADATRIADLTGLTAHDLTVDGVSGLTDADLPDSLTAINYLPLSGGSLTGDLVIGGTLTAGTLSVAGLSSGGAIEAPYFTATSSTATSTFPRLNISGSLSLSSDYVTDITGSGLSITSGALTLNTSGDWTGTLDGLEGSAYLANSFSTTSADVWKLNRNFFATTSADYWKSITDLFSTTSATYFAHSSTTIPKTYAANTWTGSNTFSALTLGSLNGPLHANAGVLSATSSIGVLYGGTGLTSAPTYGQILVGNSSGGYTLTATSSLGLPTFAYPFPNNATSTTLTFSNGLLSLASTTIGNGMQAGGLTITGGATTTGVLVVQGAATSTFAAGLQATALNVTSSSATSTFANGIRLSGGCFQMIDGTCAGSGSASLIGTTGQVAYFSGTNTALGTSTLFISTSSLVGLGTSSPAAKLTVFGDIFAEGSNRYLNFGTTTGSSGYGFRDNAGTLEFKSSGGSWQGVTTATTGPSFSVYKSGAQSLSNNTNTVLTWDTEAFDTNNNFDLSTERFTPTVPGKYILACSASITGSADGKNLNVYITKNGTAITQANAQTSISMNPTAAPSTIADANGTTDYFECGALQESGGAQNTTSGAGATTFTGALIAPVNATAGGWQNDGTQSFLADSTDKVGIGTTTPWAQLSVNPNGISDPSFVIGSSTATNFIVTNGGNVGIGTTTVGRKLVVSGDAAIGDATAGLLFQNLSGVGNISGISVISNAYNDISFGAATANILYLKSSNGNVGIGTTSPSATLGLQGSIGVNTSQLVLSASGNVSMNGNLALGTSGQAEKLFVYQNSSNYGVLVRQDTGATYNLILFNAAGASVGSITSDGSTVSYNTSSDRRIKDGIATTTLGLSELMQLPVREFSFIKDETHATTTGFIAQELQKIFPWAVTTNGDNGLDLLTGSSTPWSVDYGRITPLIVKAVQDIANVAGAFKANLIAWLANAQNGVENFFARVGNFGRVNTGELCVGSTCITETQFMAVFSQTAGAATSISVPSPSSNISEPPATDDPPISVSSSTPETTPDLTNSEQSITASSTPEVIEPEVGDTQSKEEVSSPNPATDNEPAPAPGEVTDDPPTEPANDNPMPPERVVEVN